MNTQLRLQFQDGLHVEDSQLHSKTQFLPNAVLSFRCPIHARPYFPLRSLMLDCFNACFIQRGKSRECQRQDNYLPWDLRTIYLVVLPNVYLCAGHLKHLSRLQIRLHTPPHEQPLGSLRKHNYSGIPTYVALSRGFRKYKMNSTTGSQPSQDSYRENDHERHPKKAKHEA